MNIDADTLAPQLQAGQYLTFFLGGVEYGVDILKVREIRSWQAVTQIPNTPDYVLGVINLRGIVVPIVDLRLRFSLEQAEYSPMTVVIIVKVEHEGNQRTIGMVVDTISDVYNISEQDIRPAPDFGNAMDAEFLKGLATVEEQMVVILNVDMLINVGVLDMKQSDASKKKDKDLSSDD